jgi:hypothetical protein
MMKKLILLTGLLLMASLLAACGSSGLPLGPSTLAFCGEDSLDTLYLQLLGIVTSYELADGNLNLYLGEDVGKMVFVNGGAAGGN